MSLTDDTIVGTANTNSIAEIGITISFFTLQSRAIILCVTTLNNFLYGDNQINISCFAVTKRLLLEVPSLLIIFQILTNRGKYIPKCNGRIKPGNLCKINASDSERGKYIRLQEKKEDFGEKEKHWRKKGKKETTSIAEWGDFCPPFKNLLLMVSQGYFSISYLFPYFSLSQDTHTFSLSKHSLFSQTYFPQNGKGYVLKPLSFVNQKEAVVNDRILPSKYGGVLLMQDITLFFIICLPFIGVVSAIYAIHLNRYDKLFDDDNFNTEDNNNDYDSFNESTTEVFE
jgi:hypothetical protein